MAQKRSRDWSPRVSAALVIAASLGAAAPAEADNACRLVEVRFQPQGIAPTAQREAIGPQIAVWVEDKDGKFIDTIYVTSATGLLGLGNRPGRWNMKTDYHWPYGRRSTLPVWAYKRGKTYPKVLMGGACSDTQSCGGDIHNSSSNSDNDDTIAYHGSVSSNEPYFCAPSRVSRQARTGVVDVVSCASTAPTLSKGYLSKTETSVYPPRGDIQPERYNSSVDSRDLKTYASLNDVAAVSGATPTLGKVLDPPVRWSVPATLAAGDYVMRVEVAQEADFNASYQPTGPYAAQVDPHPEWDTGYQWLGQPSVVYAVPFTLGTDGQVFSTADYAGYGDRLGQSGRVNPPDETISKSNGSGMDRLRVVQDGDGSWRVKVNTAACDASCTVPPAPVLTRDTSTGTTLSLKVQLPKSAPAGTVLEIRYSMGSPISDENFNSAVPVPSPGMTAPGDTATAQIAGLLAKTQYYVAARAKAPCGAVSAVTTLDGLTEQAHYTTLSGCFIATAAYGTPMAMDVGLLRNFRDRFLVTNPFGQVLVASYYAVSPPLAGVISQRDGVRSVARSLLQPLVALVKGLAK